MANRYVVFWTTGPIEAESAEAAARSAWYDMQSEGSDANVFEVAPADSTAARLMTDLGKQYKLLGQLEVVDLSGLDNSDETARKIFADLTGR
jgi:hypothetical protein